MKSFPATVTILDRNKLLSNRNLIFPLISSVVKETKRNGGKAAGANNIYNVDFVATVKDSKVAGIYSACGSVVESRKSCFRILLSGQ